MARKIMLYFGSFNPIHNGHLHIAIETINNLDINELWFVLSPQNPTKNPASLLSTAQRLRMLEIALKFYPKLQISTIELSLPQPSYSFFTLRQLRSQFPEDRFAILMGSDAFANFSSWRNAQEIQYLHQIYIYIRTYNPIILPLPNDCFLLPLSPIPISATQIRARIKANLAIDNLVPKAVAEYIMQQKLYR